MDKRIGFALCTALIVSACGKKGTDGGNPVTINGFNQLPSVSGVLANSGAASVSTALRLSNSLQLSGTAPTLGDLGKNLDTYIFDGLLADIKAAKAATNDQRNRFFRAQGACFMAQSTGEALGRLLQSGSSSCYMKNIPLAKSGVTIEGADPSAIFAQGDADRLVQVNIKGQPGGGGGGEGGPSKVMITVFGKSSVTSDVYKVRLVMCNAQGKADSVETILANRKTGAYETSNVQNRAGAELGSESLKATLVESGGALTFSPTAERVLETHYKGSWGIFRGKLNINDGRIVARRANQGPWGTDKNYSVAHYSGGTVRELRFLEAGYKGQSEHPEGTWTYSGNTVFETSKYVHGDTGVFAAEVAAFDFATDDTLKALTAPTADVSAAACDGTAEVTVSMDFGDAGVLAVRNLCEGERFDGYEMCRSQAVLDIESYVYQNP